MTRVCVQVITRECVQVMTRVCVQVITYIMLSGLSPFLGDDHQQVRGAIKTRRGQGEGTALDILNQSTTQGKHFEPSPA